MNKFKSYLSELEHAKHKKHKKGDHVMHTIAGIRGRINGGLYSGGGAYWWPVTTHFNGNSCEMGWHDNHTAPAAPDAPAPDSSAPAGDGPGDGPGGDGGGA
jgi:hypothetical protein